MNARELAFGISRYLRDRSRRLAVYVGPDGAIGYQDAHAARDEIPMRLAGTYDDTASVDQIAADLRAAGMQ